LDYFVADAAALIEALLSKKPPILQKPAPSRTLMPAPSSQKAAPSSASLLPIFQSPLHLRLNEGHHVGVNLASRVVCTL
ncbi:hypothetical protein Tco_0118768, partial [Tanacetum coccineum]